VIAQLGSWAQALGGEASGNSVLAPGPGHSPHDRSLSVTLDANAPDGFLVHSFAGDDPIACKDHVRAKLRLPAFQPQDRGREPPTKKPAQQPKKTYFNYHDAVGAVAYQVERTDYYDGRKKTFCQRRPDGNGGWIGDLDGVRPVPYRLPELIEAAGNGNLIVIVEGERKVDLLWSWNVPATCNSGGCGSSKIWVEHAAYFHAANVIILPDNDETGRKHANKIAASLREVDARVRILDLPGLPPKGDIVDWAAAGGTAERLHGLIEKGAAHMIEGVSLDDFNAYMPTHSYIFTPAREMWPAASVNARIPPITDNGAKPVSASAWLDQNKSVEQMTWAPGEPMLISNRLISDGGWIERKNLTCFNLYRPPAIEPGNAAEAGPWLAHADSVFSDQASHVIKWLAHRVQRPQEKINHAIVLGGNQGIGKDTLLEPVKRAIGPWNFTEVSPQQMLGRFNGFLKSVILRVSEARDLGDVDRFQFYDHMKAYTAAPPDVLRVDEKNLREHYVFNCCGVIITTNHKTDGIYLPADDRRHFVAWSDLSKEDFDDGYWNFLWNWYAREGNRHVAAYLRDLDISEFDPKAPPPTTPTFWDIVDANRAPEDAELADVIDRMGTPAATTLKQITAMATGDIITWLTDRKNRRAIPHRLEKCGYVPVRNDAANDGLWKISDARQAVYGRRALPIRDRLEAARKLTSNNR
jgi:hypothetical protein